MKIFCLLHFIFIFSCKEESTPNTAQTNNPIKDTVAASVPEVDSMEYNASRTVWQKPAAVISKLGNISEKVVVDIGAGTGYFSFRLAFHASKVIAVDIDTNALQTISSYIPKLPAKYQDRIETRLAKSNDPNLRAEEADAVVIINTAAYIPGLQNYLVTVKNGLKKGGIIMIVDYKMKRLPIPAPPKSERIYLDVVEDMLEKAGYTNIQTDDTTLDYQYIVKAEKAD